LRVTEIGDSVWLTGLVAPSKTVIAAIADMVVILLKERGLSLGREGLKNYQETDHWEVGPVVTVVGPVHED